jgi:hypothetical protein
MDETWSQSRKLEYRIVFKVITLTSKISTENNALVWYTVYKTGLLGRLCMLVRSDSADIVSSIQH